jgi:predicted phosphodiesterase
MKVQFASDIHLESRRGFLIELTDSDIIVLAGDIGVGMKGIEFAARQTQINNKPVIYIAGNHEYYRYDYDKLQLAMRSYADTMPLLYFLENDELIYRGVRILGATTWTDYIGDGTLPQEANMAFIEISLNDHRLIKKGNRPFLPEDALSLHEESKVWLTKKLDEDFDGPTLVITHHAPSLITQHLHYDYGPMSTGFLSNLDDLVKKADLWIYGHSHSNIDTMIGKCRLVSNQTGYKHENIPIPFNPNWVIDLV